MKRVRGKNNYRNYDDIDVPDMVRQNRQRVERESNTTVKRSTARKTTTTNHTGHTTKKRKSKRNRRNNFIRTLLIIAIAILAVLLVCMGMNWGGHEDETGALIPVDMEKGKLNVLLLGVDEGGLRTDSMMVASYDLELKKAELLSIPRDTQIKVTDRKVTRKINEVHAMHDENNNLLGPLGSIRAVTALTSIPIHYYVEFSFSAIDDLADAIGPVEFDVPDIEGNGKGMNYDDPSQNLHIHLKPGLQQLDGNEMQQFLRYRKSNNGTSDGSDLSRVKRQHEFLKALVDQKVNLATITKLPSILSKVSKKIKTNFSTSEMLKYAKYLNGLKSENINTYSLPGASKRLPAGWYYICDLEETAALVTEKFGYDAVDLTNKIEVNDIDGTKKVLTSPTKKKDKNKDKDKDKDKDETVSTPKPTSTPERVEDPEEHYMPEDIDGDMSSYDEPEPTSTPKETSTPKPTPTPEDSEPEKKPTPTPTPDTDNDKQENEDTGSNDVVETSTPTPEPTSEEAEETVSENTDTTSDSEIADNTEETTSEDEVITLE